MSESVSAFFSVYVLHLRCLFLIAFFSSLFRFVLLSKRVSFIVLPIKQKPKKERNAQNTETLSQRQRKNRQWKSEFIIPIERIIFFLFFITCQIHNETFVFFFRYVPFLFLRLSPCRIE